MSTRSVAASPASMAAGMHDNQGTQRTSFGTKRDSGGAERARGYGAKPTGRFSVELVDIEASA